MSGNCRAADHEARSLYSILDNVDALTEIEASIRAAGFVLGFGICRQLMVGGLTIPAKAKA